MKSQDVRGRQGCILKITGIWEIKPHKSTGGLNTVQENEEDKGCGDIMVMTVQKSCLQSGKTLFRAEQESISFLEIHTPDRKYKNERKGETSLTRSSCVVL